MDRKAGIATFKLIQNAMLGKTQEQMLAIVPDKAESVRGYDLLF